MLTLVCSLKNMMMEQILDILQIYKETELVVKFGNGEIETVLPELVNPLT